MIAKKVEFVFAIFLIVFFSQLFVRIWNIWAKKGASLLAGGIAFTLLVLVMVEEVRYGIGFRYMTAQVQLIFLGLYFYYL